jgi:hypothetical protein
VLTQDIQATATAKVASGSTVTCMLPFAILDKWDEYDSVHPAHEHDYDNGVPDPDFDPFTSTFDKYPISGGGPPIPFEPDYYVPSQNCTQPCTPIAGTGWRPFADDGITPVDYGRQVEIHTGAQDQTSSGYFQPVRLHPGDNGAADYCANIESCDPTVNNTIGQVISTENGNMEGPTNQCMFTDQNSIANLDPGAYWDDTKKAVISPNGFGDNQSPRIRPMPVISPEEYYSSDPHGHSSLTIRNILGFFVEGQTGHGGHTVTIGRLINVPASDASTTTSNTSFIRVIVLIR